MAILIPYQGVEYFGLEYPKRNIFCENITVWIFVIYNGIFMLIPISMWMFYYHRTDPVIIPETRAIANNHYDGEMVPENGVVEHYDIGESSPDPVVMCEDDGINLWGPDGRMFHWDPEGEFYLLQ